MDPVSIKQQPRRNLIGQVYDQGVQNVSVPRRVSNGHVTALDLQIKNVTFPYILDSGFDVGHEISAGRGVCFNVRDKSAVSCAGFSKKNVFREVFQKRKNSFQRRGVIVPWDAVEVASFTQGF